MKKHKTTKSYQERWWTLARKDISDHIYLLNLTHHVSQKDEAELLRLLDKAYNMGKMSMRKHSLRRFDKEQLKQFILKGKLTITDVIDMVIDINGIIGVGLITLGEQLHDYCTNKIKTSQGE